MMPIMVKDLGMIYPTKDSKERRRYGLYSCVQCGKNYRTESSKVKKGLSKKCRSCSVKKHGMIHTRINSIYRGIKTRCYNQNRSSYPRYGGRGILVCNEWKNDFMAFYNWAISNGYEDNLQIDRIDNDGNYEPSNCRWVTKAIQAQNTVVLSSNNTTGYRGVTKHKGRFISRISFEGELIYIGSFGTAVEAGVAYDLKVDELNSEHNKNEPKI